MTTEELLEFIRLNVPTFTNLRIIGHGVAYHYTDHYEAILQSGKLKGHPINENLDMTQNTIPSIPSIDEKGVLFAYLKLEDAKEEGFGCDILEVEFSSAILATHSQEATLGAPDTVIILCENILSFKKVD
jgi:hypothetical protein